MGIINFVKRLFFKDNKFRQYRITKDGREVEIHYKKPLYRRDGRTYWKGIPTDDDDFSAVMADRDEVRAYNFHVRKSNRRVRNLNRHRK